jgi:hypothetical protein
MSKEMMILEKAVYKVIEKKSLPHRKGKQHKIKIWKTIEHDNPEFIGEIVSCGMPARAATLPANSTFTTILEMPKE